MKENISLFLKELRTMPLLVLCICLIFGVLAAEKWEIFVVWIAIPFALAMGILFFMGRKKAILGIERGLDIAMLGTFVGIGAVLWNLQGTKKPVFPEDFIGKKHQMVAVVCGNVKQYDNGGRGTQVEIVGYMQDSLLVSFPAKMRLTIDSTLLATKIEKHDSLYFTGYVREVESKNVSYLNYLHRNNIYLSCKTRHFEVAGKRQNFDYQIERIQTSLTKQIFHIMPDSATAGIAAAMFLGENDFLDSDISSDFSQAGVSHILAISGQHISMIFILLNLLLTPLHFVPKGKRYKNLVVMGLLLGYMLLCGAGASVVRSVAMFCIILLAKFFRRRYKILNLMGLAAIIQIFFSPSVLFNLGFQLSYSAVASIVIFYPIFENYFRTNSRVLNEIFSWIGITLSAQVFTFPFILMAFGKFPTYFLLSNVLMALLGYVAVMVGFVMLMLAYIPLINILLGYLTHFLLKGMMLLSHFVITLPYPVIDKWAHQGILILLLQLGLAAILLFLPKWFSKTELIEDEASGLERMGLG